jgi:peptidyl-prolyl cis-trans isomerase SurA
MRIILTAIILFSSFSLLSKAETVVAEVGDEKITFEQLSKAYGKNLRSTEKSLSELDKDSVMNFIELYLDYRLKVLDAIDKGYLQDTSVQKEIKTNRRLLAESFYFENELMKPKIRDIVERRKTEYRFAFIIIPFESADSIPKEEKRAKAEKALKAIKDGMPFEEAAVKYSEDARTKNDGGKVDPWVTGGSIQKPLEDVFFKLEPGEVHDEVLETSYGCFILKLLEREVSIVSSNNFTKEKLIDELHKIISDSIPEKLPKKRKYFRVEWK